MNTVHRFLLSTLIAGLGLLSLASPLAAQTASVESYQGRNVAAGEIIVRFFGTNADQSRAAAIRAAGTELSSRPVGNAGSVLLRSETGDVASLLRTYANRPDVVYAEPNYIGRLHDTPNDSLFNLQWGLKNDHQEVPPGAALPGIDNADIRAASAWNVTKGSRSFVVGVIDSGVAYDHPDLAANIWSAPSAFSVTIGGQVIFCPAGSHGYDAILKTCDPRDVSTNGHGTHVAGTIGAVGNNGLGVSGVSPVSSIMAVRAATASGDITLSAAIDSIEFILQVKRIFGSAANVRILNNSYGDFNRSQALLDEMNQAAVDGMLFVASAGNHFSDNDLTPTYPSGFVAGTDNAPYVISVTATNNRDEFAASFSNFGATSVNIGAPGVDVFSTAPASTYRFLSGTSQAAPMVSGAAALVLAACPSLTTTQLRDAMIAPGSVDLLPSLTGKTTSGGRLNVQKAIATACGASAPDSFLLTATQGFKTTGTGGSLTSTVTMSPLGSFSSPVAIVATAPTGITADLATGSLTNGLPSTLLTITVGSSVAPGTYPVTIVGTGSAITQSTAVSVTVAPDIILGQAIAGAITTTGVSDQPSVSRPTSLADTYRLVLGVDTDVNINLRSRDFFQYVEVVSSAGVQEAISGSFGSLVVDAQGGTSAVIAGILPAGTHFINAFAEFPLPSFDIATGAYILSVGSTSPTVVGQPTLLSISPATFSQSATLSPLTAVATTLSGFGFPTTSSGPAVLINDGNGVRGTFATTNSTTTLVGTVTVDPNTSLGLRGIAFGTASLSSNTVSITVAAGVPAFTAITPNTATRTAATFVTLTGSNFNPGSGTLVLNIGTTAGVTVTNVVVLSQTTATATLTPAAAAALGQRLLTVTRTPGGTSTQTVALNVTPQNPTLISISPTRLPQGVSGTPVQVAVTLTGSNFVTSPGGLTAGITGAGVSVGPINLATVTPTFAVAVFTVAADAPAGPRAVTVATAGGSSEAFATFTIDAPLPYLSSITPSNATPGDVVPTTFTGFNFNTGGFVIGFSSTGVTASNVVVAGNGLQVTATLTVAPDAKAGGRTVTVATTAGSSLTSAVFTVGPPPPVLSSISIGTGFQGRIVPITFTGLNFTEAQFPTGLPIRVGFTGAGVTATASSVTVVDDVTMTAQLAILPTATATVRSLTVANTAGSSGSIPFTVQAAPIPTLTSISPSSILQGSSNLVLTLTGTDFADLPAAMRWGVVPVTGVTTTGTTVVVQPMNSTTAIVRITTVAINAATGPRNVFVGINTVSSGVTSGFVSLTIDGVIPLPTLTSLTPDSVTPPASASSVVPFTLVGTNFTNPLRIGIALGSGVTGVNGITTSAVTFTPTVITGNLTVQSTAVPGLRSITVSTSGGTTAEAALTVLPPAPGLTSITPTAGVRGNDVPVTLFGANFNVSGFTITGAGAGVTLGSVTVLSATTATATFQIAGNAPLGVRQIRVVTSAGTSAARNFAVTSTIPTITSVTPASGARGTQFPITVTGTSFDADGFRLVPGPGTDTGILILDGSLVAAPNGLSATAVVTLEDTAAITFRELRAATTEGGTSTTSVAFQVTQPAAPQLTAINPTSGGRGTTFPITLTGNNLISTMIVNPGTGITVTKNSVDTIAGVMTGTMAIATSAPLGDRAITFTTESGVSNSLTFRVGAVPPPTITSITPNTGSRETTVIVTILGADFDAGGFAMNAGPNIVVTLAATTDLIPVVRTDNYAIANFAIRATAAFGDAGVTVATIGGSSLSATFTVLGPPPTLLSLTPADGSAGESVPVTLVGTNFNTGGLFLGMGNNVTISPLVVAAGGTTATATLVIAPAAVPGIRNMLVTTNTGTSNTLPFTLRARRPVFASMAPSLGILGSSVPVTLKGENFTTGGFTLNAGQGITVTPVVVDSTTATAVLDIDSGATVGIRALSITTAGGTSNQTQNFAVLAPPTLISISPAVGSQGATVPVTLTGTQFVAGLTIDFGADITVGPISVQGTTSATLSLTIGLTAAQGERSVSLTTPGGVSGSVAFTVRPMLPTLTGISPATGGRTAAVPVTLSGTNFDLGVFSVSVSGTSVTPSAVTVLSPTTATAILTIDLTAVLGARTVTVSTSGGISPSVSFTVAAPPATLTGITPALGSQGRSVPVTLTGTSFVSGQTTVDAGADISVGTVTVQGTVSATVTLTIGPSAATGSRNVTITTPSGQTGPVAFDVQPAAVPTLTSLNPGSAQQGTSTRVTLAGSDFITGTTLAAGTGVNITNLIVAVGGTSATAVLTVDATAAAGSRDVTVHTSAGTSNPLVFTVQTAQLPTITAVSPVTASRGTTVTFTFTGSNLVSGTTIEAGAGITATAPIVTIGGTSATSSLTISTGAALGLHQITLTTPSGTAQAPFTINPSVPVLSAMVPSRADAGSSIPVTFYGVDLDGGGLTIDGPAGLEFGPATAVSSTVATAQLTIASSVVGDSYPITATTAGGISPSINFTIPPSAPRITGFIPGVVQAAGPGLVALRPTLTVARGAQGVPVTIRGVNFSEPYCDATCVVQEDGTLASPDGSPYIPSMSVAVSGTGITLSNFVVVGAQTATMTVSSEVDAFHGTQILPTVDYVTRDLVLSVPAGETTLTAVGGLLLTLAPTITSVEPNVLRQGETYVITFRGPTNLINSPANSAFHQGFENCTAPTPQAFISSRLQGGAAGGLGYTLNVRDPGGTPTNRAALLDVAPGVFPNIGGCLIISASTNVNRIPGITVLPNSLTPPIPPAIVPGGGVLAAEVPSDPPNSGSAENTLGIITISVSPTAPLGPKYFTYRSGGGGRSNSIEVTIAGEPVLSSMSPAFGVSGTSFPVTFNGAGFTPPIELNLPFGFTFSLAGVNALTTAITGTLSVEPGLPAGAYQMSVTSKFGTTRTTSFTLVAPGTPAITSLVPAKAGQGTSNVIAVSGANFVHGATTFSGGGAGVSINDLKVFSSTSAQFRLTIDPSAAMGIRTLFVSTTSSGTTLTSPSGLDFTILPPVPTLTSVTPSGGAQGSTIPVTLAGTNFGEGPGGAFGGGLIISVKADTSATSPLLAVTASNVVVLSPTTATAVLTIGTNNLALPGVRALTVRTESGTSGSVPFTIEAPPPPALTSLDPTTAPMGSTVPITILGSNFVAGLVPAVKIGTTTDANVTFSAIQILDSATLVANMTLRIAGPTCPCLPGGRQIVVTSVTGGTSSSLPFTITAPVPVLTSISPDRGSPGSSFPVTFAGANLNPDTLTLVTLGDITLTNLTVTTGGTGATGILTLASSAAKGPRGLQLATNGGASEVQTFTVLGQSPTLSAISPTSSVRGSSVTLTLTGTNFDGGGLALSIPNTAGVTVGLVSLISSTSATAVLNIASNATPGNRSIAVTAGGTNSTAITFAVLVTAPVLTSVAPASGEKGANIPVTLTGTNFVAGTGTTVISFVETGITSGTAFTVNTTTITATLTVNLNALTGPVQMRVATSGGTSNTIPFAIDLPTAPLVTGVTPNRGNQGRSMPITVSGANFISGTSIVVSGTGVAVATPVLNLLGTSATTTLTIDANATLGERTITLTTAAGPATTTFTVLPPAPSITGITPTSGQRDNTIPVTLSGTGFDGGNLTVDVTGTTGIVVTGVTVGPVTVISPTTATASFILAPTAGVTSGTVIVATDNGTSSTSQIFQVLGVPVITSIMPPALPRGISEVVTLRGANFNALGPLTLNLGPGITASGIVPSNTTATATVTIGAAAALGDRSITATNSSGTSNSVTFAVQAGLPPILTSISPAFGPRRAIVTGGATTSVTLFGSGFNAGGPNGAATMVLNVGTGITYGAITVAAGGTTATTILTMINTAALGPRNFSVTTSGGTSGTVQFTVNEPLPTLTSLVPNFGSQNRTAAITLNGTNLDRGNFSIIVAGTGVTVPAPGTVVTVVTSTIVTATLSIAPDAALGARGIVVNTVGGTSTPAINFTIRSIAPEISSVLPAVGTRGSTVPITLSGSTFVSGLTVQIANTGALTVGTPTGLTASPLVRISETAATTSLTISPTASLGPRAITVAHNGGTSAGFIFTVLPVPPVITSVTPARGVPGTSVPITFLGTNLIGSLSAAVSGGGVTATAVTATTGGTVATALLTIDSGATLGARSILVVADGGTSSVLFTLVEAFPDLTLTASHTGAFGVGFEESYTVAMSNVGTLESTGLVTLTGVLDYGLKFVSGTGTGWSCSAVGTDLQTVTCVSSSEIPIGADSTLIIAVEVANRAVPRVTPRFTVSTLLDVRPDNNSVEDPTEVQPLPSPRLTFNPLPLVAGQSATMALAIDDFFPRDLSGTVTLSFARQGTLPDDPAIQFTDPVSGRVVDFTIPAGTLVGIFEGSSTLASFQSGTVAGTLGFSGVLYAGSSTIAFSPSIGTGSGLVIPAERPTVEAISSSAEPQGTTPGGLPVNRITAQVTLHSTMREVNEITMTFNTTPQVRISCGTVTGCSTSGNSMTFQVKTLFDNFFATTSNSQAVLKLPLNVAGSVRGSISITFRNSQGVSDPVTIDLP